MKVLSNFPKTFVLSLLQLGYR